MLQNTSIERNNKISQGGKLQIVGTSRNISA